jgi:hypothetical protein
MNPERNQKALARRHEGQLALIHQGSIFKLNAVGEQIWKLCDGERDVNQIASLVSEKYEITLEEALVDVKKYLSDLIENELIQSA